MDKLKLSNEDLKRKTYRKLPTSGITADVGCKPVPNVGTKTERGHQRQRVRPDSSQ